MKQNVHRIGDSAFEINGKTVIVIPYYSYDIQIIQLEELLKGQYNIITIDESYDAEEDEINVYVQTNIPWDVYQTTPNPDLKYLGRENLN